MVKEQHSQKWQLGWGTVPHCNMSCEFCYSVHSRNKDAQWTTLPEWTKFIDQNHDLVGAINYGTGENTISDDWYTLIDYVRSAYPEIEQALTTNGTLAKKINDPALRDIVLRSIDEIDVSLDFVCPTKHGQFRGLPEAYDMAIDTLKFCKENDINTTIVFIGTPETCQHDNVDGIFRIAKEYNAKVRMNIYRPTHADEKINKKFILPYQTIIDLLHYINDNYKIFVISDPLFCSILTDDVQEMDPFGINSIRILPDGSITPSTYLISSEFCNYNIRQDDILKQLHNKVIIKDFDVDEIPKDCDACPYRERCRGGVFDRRYLWHKSFDQRDPYCPFNEGHDLPTRKVNVRRESDFASIHYGYLPTIFFGY